MRQPLTTTVRVDVDVRPPPSCNPARCLSLLLPASERTKVRDAIGLTNQRLFLMRSVPRDIADQASIGPAAKGAKAREEQDDEDDKLKKDYGQNEIFEDIEALNGVSRWSKLGADN